MQRATARGVRRRRLPPLRIFFRRLARNTAASLAIVGVSLGIGTWGYHSFAHLSWIDAVLKGSMILTGMGLVDPLQSTGAKVFATLYALFSGVAFLTTVAVFLAPVVHRFLHHFHLEFDTAADAAHPDVVT